MIEYVALGDFQTAVGFLLASTPEKSIRYYRDALCTLALAVRPCIPRSAALGMRPVWCCLQVRCAACCCPLLSVSGSTRRG